MPQISIIVPVYKTEQYLPKCIDSILAQTFTDYELILVDDGSPDNSGKICDEYAAKDSRIVVIHQENAGVSAARNAGLDIARGEYIGFIDSDDWLKPEMYERMIAAAHSGKFDMVICGVSYIDESGKLREVSLSSCGEHTRDEMLTELFGMPNMLGGGCGNKLFFAASISDIRFQKGISMAEDWLYLFEAIRHCEIGLKIEDPLYCVFERPGSATRSENASTSSARLLGSSLLLLLLCREREPWLEGKAIDKYLDDCLQYLPLVRQSGKKYGQPYKKDIFKIKCIMCRHIWRAATHRMLSLKMIAAYTLGMLRV